MFIAVIIAKLYYFGYKENCKAWEIVNFIYWKS